MAYEYLKHLFGTPKEGEQPKGLTFDEFVAALEGDKNLKIVNLADGGYVAKGKFDDKDTELKGTKEQLEQANKQIQAFKDMDVDGIKKSAAEWQTKYETETKALQDKLAAQRLASAEELLVEQYRYASPAAKMGVLAMLRQKGFKLDESGVLIGGKEFLDGLKDSEENKAAFAQETPPPEDPAPPAPNPRFTTGLNTGRNEQQNDNPFNLGFMHVREPGKNT